MSYKIIIADNEPVFRTGAARVVVVEDDFRIVGQCDDLPRLYKAADGFLGSLILCSSSLGPDWALLKNKVTATNSRLIVILEKTESPQSFLKHGIPGLIYRDVTHAELIQCLRSVARGTSYLQKRASGPLEGFESDMVGERARSRLSPKELRIISLIVRGYKNKDIARELNNTEQVIKNYLRSIFDKTGVSDRLELALFTMHHRILLEATDAISGKDPVKGQQAVRTP